MQRAKQTLYKSTALALTVAFVALPALAQRKNNTETMYRPASTLHGKTAVIPAGFIFEGRIDETIGSSVSKPGERFEIELSSPVLANGTDVLIPSGSKVIGEIVEAIPSSSLPRQKGWPKPTGKLRVQISGLRTPDGINYPLVANLAGESQSMGGNRRMNATGRPTQNLGRGVAYVGTQAGFEAVAPGMAQRIRGTRSGAAPQLVKKQEMMRDAIYGIDDRDEDRSGRANIRSLVKRNYNLYIFAGSPLSIKTGAPFKIGIAPAPGSAQMIEDDIITPESVEATGGRRFAKTRAAAQQQAQEIAPPEEKPLIPTFNNQSQDNGGLIPGAQFQAPPQQQQQPAASGQPSQQGQSASYGSAGTIPSSAQQAPQQGDGEKAPGTDF